MDIVKPRLLAENYFSTCQVLTEGAGMEKNVYISGIFQEAETRNQNGRIYPEHVLMPEVERYYNKYVLEGRAIGELDHPNSPTINLDRVSHKIVDLRVEGKKVYGKALIGDTECGKKAKKILEMGVRLGVSSRSLGTLDVANRVNELQLITWDIVHEPSVSTALMENLVEGLEFDWLKEEDKNLVKFKDGFKRVKTNKGLSNKEKQIVVEAMFERFLKNLL